MERYEGVRRQAIVNRMIQAVSESGGVVTRAPDPRRAPFEMRVKTRHRELDLVCYAFLANKYGQGARPEDEHRFQIKYGSEFDRYHDIFIDPSRQRITLMFGVHLERDLFIAIDPSMHNPTRFSSTIEFKTGELNRAARRGWHGWERERSSARRRKQMPFDDLRTEVLLGFRPRHFLRYAELERLAYGLDPGERLLLADTLAAAPPPKKSRAVADNELVAHALELQLGISAREILDVIGGRFRLLAGVRGGVAEYKLQEHLRGVPRVSRVVSLDEDGRPDFEIKYRGRNFLIECKNVLRRATPHVRVDFQKTRASKADPCSRYYRPDQFDILAACMHPITELWEYRFCPTRVLPLRPRTCVDRLSERVVVEGASWAEHLPDALDTLF